MSIVWNASAKPGHFPWIYRKDSFHVRDFSEGRAADVPDSALLGSRSGNIF
jgi:hypothetical protein